MTDQIFIQHRFTIQQDGKVLSDAIVLPKEEYDKLTPQHIEELKTERFENWKIAVNTPSPQVSKEEQIVSLDKDLASLEEQKAALTSMKSDLQKKVSPVEEKVIGGK